MLKGLKVGAALFLLAHGGAHLVGLSSEWQAGSRATGLLWLAAALGFAAAAYGLGFRRRWAIPVTAVVTTASLWSSSPPSRRA